MKFKLFRFKRIKSTNNIAIKKIKKNIKKGVVIADEQTKGRGQYGKKWISYKGNIFLSIFFLINNNISSHRINELNCNILKKALSKIVNSRISVKKPNDLLLNKKKFAGVLQETVKKNDKKYIIIGLGINLIKSPIIKNKLSTNILLETKKIISKEKVIQIVLKEFKKNMKKFELNV
tara:strand:- start:2949 stop:3479 length:531 start_codon:yes stop_codon:yes gene_type:complete